VTKQVKRGHAENAKAILEVRQQREGGGWGSGPVMTGRLVSGSFFNIYLFYVESAATLVVFAVTDSALRLWTKG